MRDYQVNRPEEDVMRRLVELPGTEGAILRLAWQQGLSREEICALTWDQVSFGSGQLELPDRTVPLEAEVEGFLRRAYEGRRTDSPCVVCSERSGGGMQPESVSRIARRALDRGGLKDVRLMDLRHDWIIRRLQEMDWAAVSRISGVEIPALQARFSRFAAKKAAPARKRAVDEFQLWQVLQAEKASPAGIALWLTWQLGLRAREIVDLTWRQVDLESGEIHLGGRSVLMTNAVRRLLQEVCDSRGPSPEDHVVLTEQTRRPVDLPRLSRLVRSALIRGGMEDVRLVDLRRDEKQDDAGLLDLVRERGAVSRGEVMERLGVTSAAAYARLRRLTEQGRLVRVGGKYYLPGTVVPPEEQAAAVLDYLSRWGFAYRQDIAELLRVQPRQCAAILKRLVASGQIVQDGQRYLRPEAGDTEP